METAWKLECFPNGKQKIGEVRGGSGKERRGERAMMARRELAMVIVVTR